MRETSSLLVQVSKSFFFCWWTSHFWGWAEPAGKTTGSVKVPIKCKLSWRKNVLIKYFVTVNSLEENFTVHSCTFFYIKKFLRHKLENILPPFKKSLIVHIPRRNVRLWKKKTFQERIGAETIKYLFYSYTNNPK